MNAIEVRDVRKVYQRFSQRRQFSTLKSALLGGGMARTFRPDESLEALKGVTFDVRRGQSFGVVGRNGSGKSTMLKLLAGIGKPTSGTIAVQGRVSALIELGAGFHPEISGRENVFINGLMLGLTRKEIARRFDEIVAFAELEDFIDAPVKTYSSGMYMRLGFAVATHVDPDVLLVDEVLAVGDEAFTHKCLDTFAEFRRRGRTVILVTHSLDLVDRFCDEALWLDHGVIRGQGDPRRVVDEYRLDVARVADRQLTEGNQQAAARVAVTTAITEEPTAAPDGSVEKAPASSEPQDMFQAVEGRWGSREAEVVGVEILGSDDSPTTVHDTGGRLTIQLRVRAPQRITDAVFGIGIFNAEGTCCYGTNTLIDAPGPQLLEGDATVRFQIDPLDLVAGSYRLDVAVHRPDGAPYDYHRLLYSFRVTSPLAEVGISRLRHTWHFAGGVGAGDRA